VTFAVMPLMILLTNYWRKRVRDAYRATRQRLSLINGYLNESISGIRVTKQLHPRAAQLLYFDDLNRSFFDANVRATGWRRSSSPASISSARWPRRWSSAWAATW
jgi:ATP-binding cassette subfamily B multidrug efflux pump